MREYMHRKTGEVLNEEQARKMFEEEYDGGDPTNLIEFEEIFAPVLYKYGMRARGFSIGCQSGKGLQCMEYDKTGKYYSVIAYDRLLTEKEISDYELDYIGPEARL